MLRVSRDTEVLGEMVRAMTNNLRAEELRPFLSKFDIKQFESKEWYLAVDLVEMTEQLLRERRAADAMFDLVAVGMAAVSYVPLPPEVDSVEKLVKMWETRHALMYRGTDPGYLKLEQVSDQHIILHVRNPWPDDINYGSIYGNIKRLCTPPMTFKVYYDPKTPRGDPKNEETMLHVEWKR